MSARRLTIAKPAIEAEADLGEGPVWDANHSCLVWVDILRGQLHLEGPQPRTISVDEHVGAALPTESGGWLLAVQDGFALLDEEGHVTPFLSVHDGARPDLRFNDAKVDPSGRAWAGTLDYEEQGGAGALYRLDTGPVATPILTGVGISNGLGWSPDRAHFYYVDTLARTLRAFDYADESGSLGAEHVLVELPASHGYLDGLCVDDEGCIWVAIWDGGCVRRYTPEGRLDTTVEVPVDRPTSCCLDPGGTLYITSARHGLTPERLACTPHAGAVFAVAVGATAPPATLWRSVPGAD